MSKLVYYVAATMDGYIATQQHKLDWLESFTLGDDATPYDDFYQTIGAVVMGAATYCWIISNSPDDWPYQNVPAFVMTSRDLPVPPGLDISLLQAMLERSQQKRSKQPKGKMSGWWAVVKQRLTLPKRVSYNSCSLPLFRSSSAQALPCSPSAVKLA